MADTRQQRIDTLTNAARRKSEEKTNAAHAAIRTLTRRGEPITFQAVQRQAGVSHSFLYTHPALRDRIERLRRQNQLAPSPQPDQDSENNLVFALTSRHRIEEIRDNLHARIDEARHEGWLGEVDGLQISLAGARQKLTQLDQLDARRNTVNLGMPNFSNIVGRATQNSTN